MKNYSKKLVRSLDQFKLYRRECLKLFTLALFQVIVIYYVFTKLQ